MEEIDIINFYWENKDKGRYWVADKLNINRNSFCSLIDKHFSNSTQINLALEKDILALIKKYPHTGTKSKFAEILKVSQHKIQQLYLKTKNPNIIHHFQSPKHSSGKITDEEIDLILEGSKRGIGNDLMGEKIGVDGTTIRYIRKKFLTSEQYKKYHSVDRYQSLEHLGYYNDRGDKFLSSLEQQVSDFLFENKIKYKTNVRIINHPKKYSPDILLIESNTLIEIFGMSNVECYKKRMYEKISFYTENNVKCLFLFEEDFEGSLEWVEKVSTFTTEIKDKKFNNQLKIKK